jgi:hypothetical protein
MGWFIITLTRGNLGRKVEGHHEAALGGCAVVKGPHRHPASDQLAIDDPAALPVFELHRPGFCVHITPTLDGIVGTEPTFFGRSG